MGEAGAALHEYLMETRGGFVSLGALHRPLLPARPTRRSRLAARRPAQQVERLVGGGPADPFPVAAADPVRRPRCPGGRPAPRRPFPPASPACRRPGPAMPVMPMPQVAPPVRRTPSARARATGSETAPWVASSSGGTPATLRLDLVGVGHHAQVEDLRRARHRGEQLGDQAAGAALGERHPLAPAGELRHHEVGELVLPLGEDGRRRRWRRTCGQDALGAGLARPRPSTAHFTWISGQWAR